MGSGKTTLMNLLINEYYGDKNKNENIMIINFKRTGYTILS